MTGEQIFWTGLTVVAAGACIAALLEPVLWRRYERIAGRIERMARRSQRRAARRAAGYVLMAAESLGRRQARTQMAERAAETNGHHVPGPELEAIVELEMRREAREG